MIYLAPQIIDHSWTEESPQMHKVTPTQKVKPEDKL